MPQTENFRFAKKAKFRDWAEVKIGGKWYVVSGYLNWHAILHVKYKDATDGWVKNGTKTNEVLVGWQGLDGFAGTWSED